MSRSIVTATVLTGLMVASLSATTAKGQGFDLRLPPIGLGQPGLGGFQGQPGVPGRHWPGGIHLSARHHSSVFPVHPGAGFGSHPHRGVPSGGFPTGLGFGAPGFGQPGLGGTCPQGIGSPVIGMVDQLIDEVGAFLQVFGPTAHIVPQGDRMYRDALDLYQSAVGFRQAALSGAPPHELRRIHAQMDRSCRRLVSRVNSVARGRTGPNIEQVRSIGALCRQIRTFL